MYVKAAHAEVRGTSGGIPSVGLAAAQTETGSTQARLISASDRHSEGESCSLLSAEPGVVSEGRHHGPVSRLRLAFRQAQPLLAVTPCPLNLLDYPGSCLGTTIVLGRSPPSGVSRVYP